MSKKIVLTGGGTAGHINPALAVAGYIKERHPDAKISYIGTADKLEAKLVPEKGYDFYPCLLWPCLLVDMGIISSV